MLKQRQYQVFWVRFSPMKYTTIFAICLLFPVLLAAQEANTSSKKLELGVNGATLVGGLMGGATDRLPEAVFVKYKLPNFWMRGSFQRHAVIATGWSDQNVIANELVAIRSSNRRRGSFGTLGVEWRKPLHKQVQFTYGADLLYGRTAEIWSQTEERATDFTVERVVNGQPAYDARFGPTAEMIRAELSAHQLGARLTSGLKVDLHKYWFLHFQCSYAYLYSSEQMESFNKYAGTQRVEQKAKFMRQQLPLFNELALYFRF